MKKFFLIIICMQWLSCTVQPKVVDAEVTAGPLIPNESINGDTIQLNVDKEITFEEYLNQIPILPVGYSISCTGYSETFELADNSYTPESADVVGRMKSIQNTHFVIYAYPADVLMPVLETYNRTGEKINEIQLIELGICGDIDPLNNGTSDFTIIDETTLVIKNVYSSHYENLNVEMDTIRLEELAEY